MCSEWNPPPKARVAHHGFWDALGVVISAVYRHEVLNRDHRRGIDSKLVGRFDGFEGVRCLSPPYVHHVGSETPSFSANHDGWTSAGNEWKDKAPVCPDISSP